MAVKSINQDAPKKQRKSRTKKVVETVEFIKPQTIETKGLTSAKAVADALRAVLPEGTTMSDVYFVCIGTDRSTGDSLGPMVGSMLGAQGFTNFVGTLEEPVHAMNLEETLERVQCNVHSSKIVIGIDACLGQVTSVGTMQVNKGPVRPGAGVNKDLPPVGSFHITGIVNVGGFMEYFVLQNTRLHLVMDMATKIVSGITSALPSVSLVEA